MKIVILFLLLICSSVFKLSFGQQRTFYMDSITIRKKNSNIVFNRFSSPVYMTPIEKSKTIFLGLLDRDSVYIYLKQGLFTYKSKPVPILIYKVVFKRINSSNVYSISGESIHYNWHYYQMYSSQIYDMGTIYFKTKVDSATYRLLPNDSLPQNNFEIEHQFKEISIRKKTFKNSRLTKSVNVKNNEPTKKIYLGKFKKKPIYYSVSIHPISSFPEIKIICFNIELCGENPYPSIELMYGDECKSLENKTSFFYFLHGYTQYTLAANCCYSISIKD